MSDKTKDKITAYELFIVGLCVYVIFALAAEIIFQLNPATIKILHLADTGICVIFIVDFFVNLFRKGWRYLKWGWVDLISSIPMYGYLRIGRTVRIIRLFRVLRGIRSVKKIASFILLHRTHGVAAAAAMVSIMAVIFGSICMIEFEKDAGGNIRDAGDALWWTIATITTVGYGDKYPVTPEGRILAAVIMITGVGLFVTFTGLVASWFLHPEERKQESEVAELRKEIAEIKTMLQGLAANREI